MIVPEQPAPCSEVALHYNELDEFYREVWGEHVHHGYWVSGRESVEDAVRQLVHHVVKNLELQEGQSVCDIGCGYGGTSRLLAREYGVLMTGLTVSESQIEFARQQSAEFNEDQIRYVLCPWEDNEFPDASFDAAVSIECISHVNDKPGYFEQLNRVLKPGGRASIVAWLANSEASQRAERLLLEPICREGRLPGMATAEEYNRMIADAGLKLEAYEDISRSVRRTWWICARRVMWKLMTRFRYVRALLDRQKSNRIFALTLLRILVAYHTGSMQYGIFRLHKPHPGEEVPTDKSDGADAQEPSTDSDRVEGSGA